VTTTPTVVRNQTVRIADFAVTEDVVTNHRFENCVIIGPAVVAPLESTSFVNSGFEAPPDAILWELPPGRTLVIGAIGLVNCEFDRCKFTRIGLAGPKEFIDYFRSNVRGRTFTTEAGDVQAPAGEAADEVPAASRSESRNASE
jgi:hypothetical protein